jgi:pectin methylesterase-like acyl-CoA thioesterase
MSTPQNLYSQSAGQVSSADFIAIIEHRDPTVSDSHYPVGKRWINSTNDSEWTLTSKSTIGGTVTANWESTTSLSGGAPISKYIVDADGSADYTTIQAALNAANTAGGNAVVYVRPGTYTENLTLFGSIDIIGTSACALTNPQVTVIGVHTPPATGNVGFYGLTLESATHIFSSVAAGSGTLVLYSCSLNCTNGYTYNLPNWVGTLGVNNCNNAGTNDGGVNNTGGATVQIVTTGFGNGTGNTMTLSGPILITGVEDIGCPVNFVTGANAEISNTSFDATVTFSNNSIATVEACIFTTGATAAITMSSSGAVSLSDVVINSSANPCIAGAGAGTLTMASVTFTNNRSLAGTLTTAAGVIRGGNFLSQYVVGPSPDAKYQTIQSAITAAAAAGGNAIVYVKPGTYTENLTLSAGIDIVGTSACALTNPQVTVIGVHTPPATGNVGFYGLTLESATHIFSSVAAGSGTLVLYSCSLNCTNGYTYNLPNWVGTLGVNNCNNAGTNDGGVNNTGGATVQIVTTGLGNGTGNTMTISGPVLISGVENVGCPVNFVTGTNAEISDSTFNGTVTFSNNSTALINGCIFDTGSSAAITMSSSAAVKLSDSTVNTSASTAISGSGAGLLTLGSVTFLNNSTVSRSLNVAGSNSSSGGIIQTGAVIETFPNTYLTFKSSPLLTTAATTAGAATGATGAVNLMQLQGGEIMEQFILGAGQTIIGPRMSTTGLLTSLDLTASEGAEYNFGVNATNKHAYTIGTSPAFFIELSVNAADVGGLDPFMVGFRKQQANDATLSNYTDFVSIGARATTAADVIVLQTQLNTGGVVITNTTDAWTDGQTKVFRVNVSSAGVVTYTINGAAPTVTAAFTFDSGDVVMPFIRHLFGAATPGAINWISLKIGYQ